MFFFFFVILDEQFPEMMDTLAPICKELAETGTPKQAKGAIRCIYVNLPELHNTLFPSILETIKENLNPDSPHYRTAIVSLGHIAYNVPDICKVQIKNIVSRKVQTQSNLFSKLLPFTTPIFLFRSLKSSS